ncbi:MAG: alanyl-tRNA synthetase, partial [Actinomycetota bacterium]|nr:alanyl-tRNA synthetase [Actinomycetota bacterium]
MKPTTADELRRAFLGFFEAKGHTPLPSSSLVPNDPSLLLTTAGMVQFKPYMLGEEKPPWPRATTVQKCFRTTDIDIIGTTARHLTFFEMLGNFSLGDYFKEQAIPFAWELATTVFELDPERIWVTVFETDDESIEIWANQVGVPRERIQRRGAEDNFWAMGPTGPCGPCSELYYDRGPEFGGEGGPAEGGEERYVEFWNLVFMQYNRAEDGTLTDLPQRNIDTGAGLERILALLQGEQSVFETDVLRRILAVAEATTGREYGADPKADVSLRILADHGRAMTFLLGDGVMPTNEGRGYVLRRQIRRAVRHARLLGFEGEITGPLVDATVETMGGAYPDLVRQHDFLRQMAAREEARFGETLRRGLDLLDDLMAKGDVSGEDAFFLHDTLGFPVEVTAEIAADRGRAVDMAGFRERMEAQRRRAREARHATVHAPSVGGTAEVGTPSVFAELLDASGPNEFVGYREAVSTARVVALLDKTESIGRAEAGRKIDVILDRTPFYAESGGQVGDTGTIETADGTLRVVDTVYAVPQKLILHRAEVVSGHVAVGSEATARIDVARRERTRRNHTGTHLLHWALRDVLGEHVKQAGSLVSPDRLRFDFSHFEGVPAEILTRVEAQANEEVLGNGSVRIYETTKEHAESIGAIAFFGDKYGDIVRVVEAGDRSVELCGGTHVNALGMIGPIKVLGESSIGANVRRIEALTATATLAHVGAEEARLRRAAELLRVAPHEVPDSIERLQGKVKELQEELDTARARQAAGEAKTLAASAIGGVLVARRDGSTPDDLRRLAVGVRDEMGSGVVVLVGASPDGTKAGLAVAVSSDLQ